MRTSAKRTPELSTRELRRVLDPARLETETGVWYATSHWLYAVCSPAWHAYALWGSPDEHEVQALLSLFVRLGPLQTPHAVLADVRFLRSVTPGGFEALSGYVQGHGAELGSLITTAWIAHDASWMGALASGFFGVQAAPFPVHASAASEELRLGIGADVETWAAYEAASTEAREDDGLRARLEAIVRATSTRPTLEEIARAVALSPRSLQRRLQAMGTTVPREITRVRVAQAQTLLSTSSTPITEIAYTLGFATPEHFATSFRETTGESPTAYRARSGATP